MSRISTMAVALALCLTLFFSTLPYTRAYVQAAPAKEVKQQEKSCATCPASSPGKKDDKENAVNNLTTMGRRTQQIPFLPVQRSIFDGGRINMVSTANGSLVFAVTDLQVSGLMPLAFVRVYGSDRAEDRGLGAGWSFAYDDRVRVDGDEAVMSTGAGVDISFRREGQSNRFVLKTPEPGLRQSFEEAANGTLTESASGLTRTYRKVGDEYRLARISDANGNSTTISFDRSGNISRVEGGGGRSLRLSWSSAKQPRLLSVTDNIGRRTSYVVRGGHLAAYIDQAGSEWTYKYSGGRLVGASDPLGHVLLQARYDRQGRAVESGDAAGSHFFAYDEGASGRTVVTDPLGAKVTFTHNALGAVSSLTDDEGKTARVEYSEGNRPVRVSDSSGNQQTFAREANKSGDTAFTYDARGNVLSARTGDPSTSYRAVRNDRGQPVSLRSESGRELIFEYDAAGNEAAVNYSDVGRFEKRYDGAGRVTYSRMPSGLFFEYEYDRHGQVAKVTENNGRARTIERDLSGIVTKVTSADGKWVRVTRDEAGRITRMVTSDGRSRQYAYDARGALTYFRNEQGRQYTISYDRRGRVQKAEQSYVASQRYGRDGRIASVKRVEQASALNFVRASFNFSPPPSEWDGQCSNEPDQYPSGYVCNPYNWEDWGSYGWVDFGDGSYCWDCSLYGGGTGSQSRQECISRNLQACESRYNGCVFERTGYSILALAACTAITAFGGLVLCVFIVEAGGGMLLAGCNEDREACRLQAANGCPP